MEWLKAKFTRRGGSFPHWGAHNREMKSPCECTDAGPETFEALHSSARDIRNGGQSSSLHQLTIDSATHTCKRTLPGNPSSESSTGINESFGDVITVDSDEYNSECRKAPDGNELSECDTLNQTFGYNDPEDDQSGPPEHERIPPVGEDDPKPAISQAGLSGSDIQSPSQLSMTLIPENTATVFTASNKPYHNKQVKTPDLTQLIRDQEKAFERDAAENSCSVVSAPTVPSTLQMDEETTSISEHLEVSNSHASMATQEKFTLPNLRSECKPLPVSLHGKKSKQTKRKTPAKNTATSGTQKKKPASGSCSLQGPSAPAKKSQHELHDSSSSSDEEKRRSEETSASEGNSSTYSDKSAAQKQKRVKKPSKGMFRSDPATPPVRSKKSCTEKTRTSEPLASLSGSEAEISSTYHNRSAAKKWKRMKKSSKNPTTPPVHSKKSHTGKRKISGKQRSSPAVQPIPVQGHKPKEHEESESDTSVLQGVVANGFETAPRSKPKVRSHREVKGRFPLTPPKRKKLSKKSTRHTSDTEYGGSSYVSSSSSHKSHPDSDVSTNEPLWIPRYPTRHFSLLLSEDPQVELESISLQPEPAVIRSEEIQQHLQPILHDVYHALLGCRGMPVQIVPQSSQHTGFHLHPYLDLCVAGGRYAHVLSVLTALLDCGVLCSQSGISVAARLIDVTVDVERGRLILGPTCFQSTQTPQAFVQVVLRLAKRLREAVFAYHAGEIATSSVVSCHNAAAAVSVPTTVHQFVAVLSSFIRLVESRLSDEQQVDIEFLKYLVNSQL